MAVFDLLAHSVTETSRWVVVLGLVFIYDFDHDVRAEEFYALAEVLNIFLGAFGGF